MTVFNMAQRSGDESFKVKQEGTVHLVITGGNPPYTHVEISTSTKAALQSNSIKYDIRKHSSEAIITLKGVPREAMTISVVVEVADSNGVLDNVSFQLQIHSDISDENIQIKDNIHKARSGFSYSFDISNKNNKDVNFYLDSVSADALRDVGITLSDRGILSATSVRQGIKSDYEIGVVFKATKNGKPVNITNNRQKIIILPEITLNLDDSYVNGNEIDSLKGKGSSDITFISNNELKTITPRVEIINDAHQVLNKQRFTVSVSDNKLILRESSDPNVLNAFSAGKYTLNIIAEDADKNKRIWPYQLNILEQELPIKVSVGALKGAEMIKEFKPQPVYEIRTGEDVKIPIIISGGLKPFKKNDDIEVYEGMKVSTVDGSIILNGKVSQSVDSQYTKYKKQDVNISVTDRNSRVQKSTINLLVNMPPVGKNISSDDAPELGKGSTQNIGFDQFSDIDPEQYNDYYKAYPSHIAIVGSPRFTDSKVTWTQEKPSDGSVIFTGKIETRAAITIKFVGSLGNNNHGVVITTTQYVPDGHLSFSFKIENKNGKSSIARTASIPVQDSMPVASLTLNQNVQVNKKVEIDPLVGSVGAPFDAVAISGESLSNIKGELKVTQKGDQYRLSVTVNDHQGGTEDIVFYLIKGYRASKGKVTLNITK